MEEEREAEEILDGINMKLERMRERWMAAKAAREEDEAQDGLGDDGAMEVPDGDVSPPRWRMRARPRSAICPNCCGKAIR
jgi:hypothetical protein